MREEFVDLQVFYVEKIRFLPNTKIETSRITTFHFHNLEREDVKEEEWVEERLSGANGRRREGEEGGESISPFKEISDGL